VIYNELGQDTFSLGQSEYIVSPGARLYMRNGKLVESMGSITDKAMGIVQVAGVVGGAYHGYRRNKSVGWAIGWAIAGGMFPLITGAIAVAQGYGKPK